MNDAEFDVDILDQSGKISSTKKRKEITKGVDIYHAVYGVIITPEKEIVISLIGNPAGLPNLHAGKLGCTCATIRRTNETADQAMERAIKKELKIEQPRFKMLSEDFIDIDNTKRLIAFYVIASQMPTEYNREDIEELQKYTFDDFIRLVNNQTSKITPPLKLFWEKFKDKEQF